MEERFLRKLRKLLGKAGVDEEKTNSILNELSTDEEPEEVTEPIGEQVAPEVAPKEPSEPAPTPEVEPTGENEIPPQEEEPVGVVDTPEEAGVPNEEPLPPEMPVEPEPQVDPTAELRNIAEEQQKTIDGLLARIDSLEDALRKSNILRDDPACVGVDESNVPANNPDYDDMEETLNKFNRRH